MLCFLYCCLSRPATYFHPPVLTELPKLSGANGANKHSVLGERRFSSFTFRVGFFTRDKLVLYTSYAEASTIGLQIVNSYF